MLFNDFLIIKNQTRYSHVYNIYWLEKNIYNTYHNNITNLYARSKTMYMIYEKQYFNNSKVMYFFIRL